MHIFVTRRVWLLELTELTELSQKIYTLDRLIFYNIFEQFESDIKTRQTRQILKHVIDWESADRSQICGFKKSRSIWLERNGLPRASIQSVDRKRPGRLFSAMGQLWSQLELGLTSFFAQRSAQGKKRYHRLQRCGSDRE